YASASTLPGSSSIVSIEPCLGAVNAWCTAVHAPEPTATSPCAAASSPGSNSGGSTTQTNAHSSGSIMLRRCAISMRAAPSSALDDFGGPAEKNTQSPGAAPTCAANPSPSASERVL